jgi:small subunit ribosomal protein S28e
MPEDKTPKAKEATPTETKVEQKPDSGKGGKGAPAPQTPAKDSDKPHDGFLAEVVGVEPNRTGIYGEIKQAMCKILEGRDKGRVIRRNFAGRIKKGDLIRLPDTSREDKRIVAR